MGGAEGCARQRQGGGVMGILWAVKSPNSDSLMTETVARTAKEARAKFMEKQTIKNAGTKRNGKPKTWDYWHYHGFRVVKAGLFEWPAA